MKLIFRCKVPSQEPHAVAVPQDFHCPLPQVPRTAVLCGGFRSNKSIRVFPAGFDDDVLQYQPELIAAPARVLRTLARQAQCGLIQLPSLQYAIVVLTEMDGAFLVPDDRELFWDVFGVPVYEQLVGLRFETLAVECEAHQGLHVVHQDCPSKHIAATLKAQIVDTICGCGQAGQRLLPQLTKNEVKPLVMNASAQTA